jgi:NAD(P)-dependent dehydrogenase (short-subunit alcohol dehydrogenase family)
LASAGSADRSAALVTGSTRGIGRAIAERLAADGFQVILHGRTPPGTLADLLASLPGRDHFFLAGDLADPDTPERLIAEVRERVDRLDVLVNNAAIAEVTSFSAPNLADWRDTWRRTLRINLEAAAELAFLAADHMRGHGGKIIQIASRSAFRGETEYPAYAVSKAGMVNLTVCLARALAKEQVYAYAVAPGFTDTEMGQATMADRAAVIESIPFGRMATPEEVAGVVAFLVRPEANYLSGITIDVNGASYFR